MGSLRHRDTVAMSMMGGGVPTTTRPSDFSSYHLDVVHLAHNNPYGFVPFVVLSSLLFESSPPLFPVDLTKDREFFDLLFMPLSCPSPSSSPQHRPLTPTREHTQRFFV